MPKSNKGDTSGTAAPGGSAARTHLNHIVGYSGILRQDALDAGRADLASLFATIAESAEALESPLSARLDEADGDPPRGETLDHEIYGILYALVALVQSVKGKASAAGFKGLSAETDRLLEASNSILELMASNDDSPKGAADEEPSASAVRDSIRTWANRLSLARFLISAREASLSS